MGRRSSTLRFVSLLAVSALVLHELRDRIGHCEHPEPVLRAHGHAYLAALGAVAAGPLTVALAWFLALLADGQRSDPRAGCDAPFVSVWVRSGLSLASIHVTEDPLEGWLASGHPGGPGRAGRPARLAGTVARRRDRAAAARADVMLALAAARRRRSRRRGTPRRARLPPRFAPGSLEVLACTWLDRTTAALPSPSRGARARGRAAPSGVRPFWFDGSDAQRAA